MALETPVTYISDLVATNPVSALDNPRYSADHIRNVKGSLLATFPNVTGAVTPTHTELNYVDGVTSAIQTQLNALASVTQNTQNGNYTLDLADANKHIYKDNTSAYAWTVPPNSSKAFPIGTTVTMVNAGSSGAITITRDTGVAIITAGSGTDSNKTLAPYGLATLLKVATNTWYISGAGVS
jgi:hypothetical protein